MRSNPSTYNEANEIDTMARELKRDKDFQEYATESMLNRHMDSNDISEAYYKFIIKKRQI